MASTSSKGADVVWTDERVANPRAEGLLVSASDEGRQHLKGADEGVRE